MAESFEQIIDQDHQALEPFVKGDPEPKKTLYSRRDDVTLANPLGPPARGFKQIAEALDRASASVRDGEVVAFERVSEYATADLAYMVEIERTRLKIGDSDETVSVSLRATTIFRREDDGWKVVHRHADPITAPRPVESVVEQ
jgi:ketosteroid isomerase-like protein